MLDIDQKIFDENLLITKQYCEKQLQLPVKNNASVLRSFNPEYNGKPLFSFGVASHKQYSWNETEWSIDPILGGNENFYDELFKKQNDYKRTALSESFSNKEILGRILVAEIDKTVIDGASESCSDGFFDVNDCPPIDTWFYLFKDKNGLVLFAWIPLQFIELTQKAIDVNPIDCFNWFEGETYFSERNAGYERALNYRNENAGWFKKLIKRIF
ncbi:hypothetical protein [Mucilaginibacter glaciei]|uniref:Uncharacterized protein n=1 Tax=Mucilaginibacter glaciei TaxID=2772109 RepID=A0A926NPG3_9SPHI|nr:hypothetical protein [Mucilaginibacter glaciei]MBD1394926.1 hypothetical protein [Mucilaginibacter glaciei]